LQGFGDFFGNEFLLLFGHRAGKFDINVRHISAPLIHQKI
jgi:hypothetical protein